MLDFNEYKIIKAIKCKTGFYMDKNNSKELESGKSVISTKDGESMHGMFEFLTELGKALTSAGISVTAVQSILEDITEAYNIKAEIIVLPTVLLIKLGNEESAPLTAANQLPGSLPLHQVSELYELIYQAEKAEISPIEGKKRIKEILSQKHRFGLMGIFIGYILFAIGLGMLLQPTSQQLIASGGSGAIIGLLLIFSKDRPRFALILPVIAALLVSTFIFWGIKEGLIIGSIAVLIPALAYFLPGATFTTGMFELASGDIVSGSSRVIYGIAILFLLLFGVLIGMQLIGLPQQEIIAAPGMNIFKGWMTFLGVLIFAVGMYFFMSIRDKDLPWILLVLYIAFLGQQFGNYFIGGFSGAFLGSLLMTISGTLVGRSPLRTPSFVSILPAFWILVPGSLGFISLASLIGQNYFSAINDITSVVMTVVAISMGLLVGAAIIEPLKLGKIKSKSL